jgi:hypothetical protein
MRESGGRKAPPLEGDSRGEGVFEGTEDVGVVVEAVDTEEDDPMCTMRDSGTRGGDGELSMGRVSTKCRLETAETQSLADS